MQGASIKRRSFFFDSGIKVPHSPRPSPWALLKPWHYAGIAHVKLYIYHLLLTFRLNKFFIKLAHP